MGEKMTAREEVLRYIQKEYGVTAQRPWAKSPENEVLRHADNFLLTASKKKKKEMKRTGPKDWLIPANPKYYDVVGAFRENKVLDWKQSSDIRVGDFVYMYVAAPYSSIMYKCKALEVDIPSTYSDDNLTIRKMMMIELLETYEPGIWTFERIKQFGVHAVRGPRSMPVELKEAMEIGAVK